MRLVNLPRSLFAVVVLAMGFLVAPVRAWAQQEVDASAVYLGPAGTTCRFSTGTGSPESAATDSPCAIYVQRDSPYTLWRKFSGTGNTGWRNVTFTPGAAGTFTRSDGTNIGPSTLVLPNAATSGDILKASGSNTYASVAPAALTKTDDTNVTLTLGGSASSALVNAASLTLGWTGRLPFSRFASAGAANTVLAGGAGDSSYTATPTVTSLTASSLTNTRVTFAGASGLLSDDADMTFATDTLSITKINTPWIRRSYTSGFTGSGYSLDYDTTTSSQSFLEVDQMSVRGIFSVYELLVHQIRATNGSVFISNTAKAADVVTLGGGFYTITTETAHGFAVNDLIRAQRFTGAAVYQSNATVTAVASSTVFTVQGFSGDEPATGMDFVRLGSSSDATRRASIYLTADDTNAPYINIIDGVATFSDWGTSAKTKVRLGQLNGACSYSGSAYGFCAGDGAGTFVSMDSTNCFRVVSGGVTKTQIDCSGNATFVGVVAAGATLGGFNIGSDYVRDVANSMGMRSTVTGGDDCRFWAGDTYANCATAPFHVFESGVFQAQNLLTNSTGVTLPVVVTTPAWDSTKSYGFRNFGDTTAALGMFAVSVNVAGPTQESHLYVSADSGANSYTNKLVLEAKYNATNTAAITLLSPPATASSINIQTASGGALQLATDLKFTDNTYDIGKSGATRPRDGFFSRNAVFGGDVSVGGGDLIGTANTDFHRDTSDGSDNGIISLSAAGTRDRTRGAWMSVNGNEGGSDGYAIIATGNTSGARVQVMGQDGTSMAEIRGSGTVDGLTSFNLNNLSTGTSAYAGYGINNSAGEVAWIAGTGTGNGIGGVYPVAGMLIRGNQSGGITIAATHASGDTRIWSRNALALTLGASQVATSVGGFAMATWPTTANPSNAEVADGNTVRRSTSLSKFKGNVREITVEDARRAVMTLRPVTYTSLIPTDDKRRTWPGFIAEEVANAVPYLAMYGPKGDLQSVAYDRVAAYLLPLVRNHEAKIAALEADIAMLKTKK